MTAVAPERVEAVSGVGVLDKASLLLEVMERGPASLAELVARTGLKRPTVYRLATALERLRLVARDRRGRFVLGPRLGDMAVEAGRDRLVDAAGPVLRSLRDCMGVSARLYRRHGDLRVCVAAASGSGTGEDVPLGAAMPMTSGSAAQALVAWESPESLYLSLRGARYTAATLACVRRRGLGADRRYAGVGDGVGGGAGAGAGQPGGGRVVRVGPRLPADPESWPGARRGGHRRGGAAGRGTGALNTFPTGTFCGDRCRAAVR